MFLNREPYGVSFEMLSCIQLGLCASVSGFIIGGIDNTKSTVSNFKEQNQAAIFENTFQAQVCIPFFFGDTYPNYYYQN